MPFSARILGVDNIVPVTAGSRLFIQNDVECLRASNKYDNDDRRKQPENTTIYRKACTYHLDASDPASIITHPDKSIKMF